MRLTLTLTQAPVGEPVTLEEVHQFLKLDHTEDDSLLKRTITSARTLIENYANRALFYQTWRAFYGSDDSLPHLRLPLPRAPFYALKNVPTAHHPKGERPLKTYRLIKACSCGIIMLTQPLLVSESLSVDFVAGYGEEASSVPEPFRQALLMMVAEMYERRWSSSSRAQPSLITPAVRELLAPLRIMNWI